MWRNCGPPMQNSKAPPCVGAHHCPGQARVEYPCIKKQQWRDIAGEAAAWEECER